MGFEKEKIRQIRNLLLLTAALVLLLMYSQNIGEILAFLISIAKPFLYGGVIAFVLNIPLCGIERLIDKLCRGKQVKWKQERNLF